MSKSIRDIAKKRGRPKTTGLGEGILVRMHKPFLTAIDEWRSKQGDKPSRAEALRRLAMQALAAESPAKPPRKKRGAD
jgi:hypothetical protein